MFTQILLTSIQSWTQALPVSSNNPALLDQLTGLLTFLGTTIYNTHTQQARPDPSGTTASNSLINFWNNLCDGFLTQTHLLQSLIHQERLTYSELTHLIDNTSKATYGSNQMLQPSDQSMATALKILLGILSANNLENDPRYRWGLLLLLAFVCNPECSSNTTNLDTLYNYLFNNGPRPVSIVCINDPTITHLLPSRTVPICSDHHSHSHAHTSNKNDFCHGNIAWYSNHVSDTYQRICKKIQEELPSVFPNATNLILNFLAQDAKGILQDQNQNLNWSDLRKILKKVLVMSMFTGKHPSQIRDKDNNNGGKKW